MILDSHIHLFRNGYFGDAGTRYLGGQTDLSAYRALAKTHGISGALVICYEADGIDPTNNAYLREIAPAEPWITSLAFLPADTPPSLAELSQHLRAGHAGFALYLPDAAAGARLAAWPEEVWKLLSDAQAILSLNARPAAIEALAPTLTAYPGLRILFSHLGLPGRGRGQGESDRAAGPSAGPCALPACGHQTLGPLRD